MSNPVVYFEIAGKDGKRLQQFYSTVFGWEMDTTRTPGYAYINTGAAGAPHGGIREERDVPPDKVLYIRVPDLGAALAMVKTNGGQVLIPVTEVPGVVTFALFRDPEGNVMGLIK
jgi:predicted enzyme related to lactoylglutathione lyase